MIQPMTTAVFRMWEPEYERSRQRSHEGSKGNGKLISGISGHVKNWLRDV